MTPETADPRRILLVEDDAIIALGERAIIDRNGFAVTCAHSGEEAIRHVENGTEVDLVLMDIDLGPGIDGVEAAARILERRTVPIVFLTSHTEKHYVDRVREITNYGYIIKSSGEFVLLESIRMAFELFEANRTAARREEELQKSKARHRDLFDNAPVGIFQTDSQGRMLSVNPAMAHMLGASSPEEAIEHFTDLARQLYTDESRRTELLRLLRERERVEGFEFEARTVGGERRYFRMEARMHSAQPDGTFFIDGFAIDVTQRKLAERALAEREEHLDTTLQSIGDGVIVTDLEGRITRMNPVAEQLTGFPSQEASGRALHEVLRIVNSVTREPADNPVLKAIRTGAAVELANHTKLISRSGREYQLADSAAPIRDRRKEMTGVVMVFRDFTEEYEKTRRLSESRRFLQDVFDAMQDGISVVDTDMTITSANHWMAERFGVSDTETLEGRKCYEVYRHRTSVCPQCPVARARETGTSHGHTVQVEETSGRGSWWAYLSAYPMRDEAGNVTGVIEAVRDVTEQKQAEQRLQEALAQKEHLMQELNHRVKNNLSMVSSLLSLKQSALGDSTDLSDIGGQIDAIRIVHEKLHQEEAAGGIDLREYLHDLLTTVFSSFATREVSVEHRIPDIHVGSESAVPLGLLVNELATNAIQHGFHEEAEPWFRVVMEPAGDEYALKVSNSGRPFPEKVDFENPDRLGLQLVQALSQQLGGSAELSQRAPATFVVRFPAPSP
ncbi:MAG: PAS domain S-box protein [Spirochaetes bacterium]|jgi:PAS domain S-box-containing protein|nr:PAS domain S-box protein [Spirochaetota bacterium]